MRGVGSSPLGGRAATAAAVVVERRRGQVEGGDEGPSPDDFRDRGQRHGLDKDHCVIFVVVVVVVVRVVIAAVVATGGQTMTIPPPPPPPPLAADRRTPWRRGGRRQRCVPSTIASSVMGGEDMERPVLGV